MQQTTSPSIENLTPDHLRTLFEISLAMNSSLEFDAALVNVINAMVKITHAERGVLMGVNKESGEPEVLAAYGVDGQALQEEEAYSTTIVKHVVRTRETLLTNNAMFDSRITPGHSIVMRALRAILCAPMVVKDRLIGVVYVDTSLRTGNFTLADRDLLNAVARQAAMTLENARLYSIALEKGRMEEELTLARQIQNGLLPRHLPEVKNFQVAAHLQSAREMAGDFYDSIRVNDHSFSVTIADVSDKGAPSAMFMAVARSMIRSYTYAGFSAYDTITHTNDLILNDAEKGMFVTVYHSMFTVDGSSKHINAGHNPPLLYRAAQDEIISLPRGGRAVGWFPDNPLHETDLQLSAGDVIVYYTDGLTEHENEQGEPFGESRLTQLLRDNRSATAQQILTHIVTAVQQFAAGVPLSDDLTLVVVRYTGE